MKQVGRQSLITAVGLIFISHRESERSIAEALLNYFLAALDIPEIRCTSVQSTPDPFPSPSLAWLEVGA